MISSLSPVSSPSSRGVGFGSSRKPSDTEKLGVHKPGIPELDSFLQQVLKVNRKDEAALVDLLKRMEEKVAHTRHMLDLQKIPTSLRQAHHLVPNMATETVAPEKIAQFVHKMGVQFAKTNDVAKQKVYLQSASLAVLRYAQKQAQLNLFDADMMPIVHSLFVSKLKAELAPAPKPWQRQAKSQKLTAKNVQYLPTMSASKPFEVNDPKNPKEWVDLALSTWKTVLTQAGQAKSQAFFDRFNVDKCTQNGDVLLIIEEPKKWTKYKV